MSVIEFPLFDPDDFVDPTATLPLDHQAEQALQWHADVRRTTIEEAAQQIARDNGFSSVQLPHVDAAIAHVERVERAAGRRLGTVHQFALVTFGAGLSSAVVFLDPTATPTQRLVVFGVTVGSGMIAAYAHGRDRSD